MKSQKQQTDANDLTFLTKVQSRTQERMVSFEQSNQRVDENHHREIVFLNF